MSGKHDKEMRGKLVRPRFGVFGKLSTNLTLSFLSFFPLTFSYFIYLFRLCWVFVSVRGPSLVAVSRACSLVAVHSLLVVMASLTAEHGL